VRDLKISELFYKVLERRCPKCKGELVALYFDLEENIGFCECYECKAYYRFRVDKKGKTIELVKVGKAKQ